MTASSATGAALTPPPVPVAAVRHLVRVPSRDVPEPVVIPTREEPAA